MPAIVDFNTIPELFYGLETHYEAHDRPVLRHKDRSTNEWSALHWADVRNAVHSIAGHLYSRGVRSGDRVAIMSENRPEWAITDLATQILGAVNVSLYTIIPSDQVQYIVKDSGSKLLVVSTMLQQRKAIEIYDGCPKLDEIITMNDLNGDEPSYVVPWHGAMRNGRGAWKEHEDEIRRMTASVKPDDLSALIYTSGTTGKPKGVMLTHRNFSSNTKAALREVPIGPEDHHLSFLPLCHSLERTAGYTAVMSSGALISYAESIDAVSRNMQEVSPTVMISVPRLFERIYNTIAKSVEEGSPTKQRIFRWAVDTGMKTARRQTQGKRVGPLLRGRQAIANKLVFAKLHEKLGGRLRFAFAGGAALPKKIGEFFQAAGITIIEGYGLTETAPVLTINPLSDPRFGTVGHVIPGVTIAIQRLSDQRVIGQLAGDDYPSSLTTDEGEIICRGPNIMTGYWQAPDATEEVIDKDGWFHTGDVGRFDDGYLLITDRIKHMIVSAGGKNIYPGPIEDTFKTVQWINQLLVVGEGREFLVALVVPELEALESYARKQSLEFSDTDGLLKEEIIQELFENEFRSYSRIAAAHEKIRDFRLIAEPFTVENELLTPSLKPKRRLIEKKYADIIDEMYALFGQR